MFTSCFRGRGKSHVTWSHHSEEWNSNGDVIVSEYAEFRLLFFLLVLDLDAGGLGRLLVHLASLGWSISARSVWWLQTLLEGCRTQIASLLQSATQQLLQLLKVVLWLGTPVIDDNGWNTTEREQGSLLHGLFVRAEMLGCHDIPVDKSLVRIHPVKDSHGSALAEDWQVWDQVRWELVKQACHREVGKERGVGNSLLPFSFAWNMVSMSQDSFPLAVR